MILDIVWLLAGLLLIVFGASMLTDGASAIARRMGMSDLVVGLTVVAFGTSAPELVISIVSALQGNAPMAIGNVVGSNIFNILAIIGVVALVRPIKVEKSIMVNEIPFVGITALILLAMGNTVLLDGARENVIGRVDGIILLLLLAIFMRYTFAQSKKGGDSHDDPSAQNAASRPEMGMVKAVVWTLLGLSGLIFGGDRFVDGASGLAKSFGVSDAVIGLTIVAAGTSLPELAASVAAAMKGHTGIAIGNVIGSNILNILLVLGTASVISPLPFGDIGNFDLLTMTAACLLFWLFARYYRQATITRLEGGVLVAGYLAYILVLVLNATNL